MLFCIIGTLSLQYLSNKIELVHTLVTINTNISFFFSLFSILFILFPVYILTIFSDYIKKYWLYNEKTHKYDVFKVMDNSDNIILVTIILQQRRYITSRELVINNLRRRISMLENHIVHLDTEEQTHLYFFEDL
jgi:ABC-type multidrug transport system fused ATPase/permease subunit